MPSLFIIIKRRRLKFVMTDGGGAKAHVTQDPTLISERAGLEERE